MLMGVCILFISFCVGFDKFIVKILFPEQRYFHYNSTRVEKQWCNKAVRRSRCQVMRQRIRPTLKIRRTLYMCGNAWTPLRK